MDTTDNTPGIEKQAQWFRNTLRSLGLIGAGSGDLYKAYLTYAALMGVGLGGAGGALVNQIKAVNPNIRSLDLQKQFYDKKISEMENENWLNDILTIKKRLENGKLSDEERSELEKKYKEMINSGK